MYVAVGMILLTTMKNHMSTSNTHDLPPLPSATANRAPWSSELTMFVAKDMYAYALAAIAPYKAEIEELKTALHNHFDLAPQRYAAAKAALPIIERSMRCPFCDEEFADGVLHDTGLALINTYDRAEKAEAEVAKLRELLREWLSYHDDELTFGLPERTRAALKDQP
jgi:hypothetical protein